jgi:transposase
MVRLVARVESLEAENAELRRRLGMNSRNSSTPPSKDSIRAKAARQADRSSRERSKDRKPWWAAGPQGFGAGAGGDAGSD